MNNKFFVPVLALGIAALGAAASPSRAATATLGLYSGPDGAFQWLDEVTLERGSTWNTATQEEAQDGGPYQIVGQPMSTGYNGPGSPSIHTPIVPPPSGHSYKFLILNYGSAQGGSVSWEATAGPGSVSNNNGTINVTT